MEGRKALVLATAVFALLSLGGSAFYYANQLPGAIAIDTTGYPSIGEGEIEVVIFEDFRCAGCRYFNKEIFPAISVQYIETGRVRYTVIPLAFIDGSKPLANAALAVHHIAPHRFIPFIQETFRVNASSRRELLSAAKKVGGIDLYDLAQCIDEKRYYKELEGNLQWAQQLLGKQFGTPALFVNGIPTSTANFDAISNRIDQIEKQK